MREQSSVSPPPRPSDDFPARQARSGRYGPSRARRRRIKSAALAADEWGQRFAAGRHRPCPARRRRARRPRPGPRLGGCGSPTLRLWRRPGGPRPPAGVAGPESSGSYRAFGGRLQGCPRGVSDPGGAPAFEQRRSRPGCVRHAAPFARPVALHCGKPVWSWRRGTRGGGRRVRPGARQQPPPSRPGPARRYRPGRDRRAPSRGRLGGGRPPRSGCRRCPAPRRPRCSP